MDPPLAGKIQPPSYVGWRNSVQYSRQLSSYSEKRKNIVRRFRCSYYDDDISTMATRDVARDEQSWLFVQNALLFSTGVHIILHSSPSWNSGTCISRQKPAYDDYELSCAWLYGVLSEKELLCVGWFWVFIGCRLHAGPQEENKVGITGVGRDGVWV